MLLYSLFLNLYIFLNIYISWKKERRKVFCPKVPENFGGTHGYLGKKSQKKIKKFPFFIESFTVINLFYYSLKNGVSVMDKEVDNVYKKYRDFLQTIYKTVTDLFLFILKIFCDHF
jgi:hypothetical protein